MAIVLVPRAPTQQNSVQEILPDVYLGNCESRLFVDTLAIKSIVQIGTLEEHQKYIPVDPKINILKITVADSNTSKIEEYFDIVLQFVSTSQKPILFHCNAGVSRSPTLLTVLLLQYGYSVDNAIQLIRDKRLLNGQELIYTQPKPAFLRKLKSYINTVDPPTY